MWLILFLALRSKQNCVQLLGLLVIDEPILHYYVNVTLKISQIKIYFIFTFFETISAQNGPDKVSFSVIVFDSHAWFMLSTRGVIALYNTNCTIQ